MYEIGRFNYGAFIGKYGIDKMIVEPGVGVALIGQYPDGTKVLSIFVKEEYRGLGIGTALGKPKLIHAPYNIEFFQSFSTRA